MNRQRVIGRNADMMKNNSKIFVAGATGLVGSAIVKKLLSYGFNNILGSYCRNKPDDQYSQLSSGGLHFVQLDMTDQQAVANFFGKHRPEFVFLSAAKVGGIMANNTYRAQFIYENLQIQNNIIHQSYLNRVKKLLFLGSSCIYPKECPQPMREEYLLSGPLEYTNEPYAIAKIAGMRMCESYNLQYGTNFIAVMPTNLYGPHDNYNLETSHVLPALIRKFHLAKLLSENRFEEIRNDIRTISIGFNFDFGSSGFSDYEAALNRVGIFKDAVELWGTGRPRREFLYSEDLADACTYLMKNTDFSDLAGDAKEVRNTHLNIGCGTDISIKELAELAREVVAFDGDILFDGNKPDGTMQKLLDISRLKALGWTPSITLKQGIKMSYESYLAKDNIRF